MFRCVARRLRWVTRPMETTATGSKARRPGRGRSIAWESHPGAAVAPIEAEGGYRRRQPDATVLYRLFERQWGAFVGAMEERSEYGSGIPGYVMKEVAAYLACGRLELGFARVVCRDCRDEMVVGFSCKKRGLCPSCSSRRMSDTAAALVDRVIPFVPIRQWVATVPPRVRWHLARDPKLCGEVMTRVIRELFNFQRRRARRMGLRLGRANASGAITFVQRFNSAIQLALHAHVLMPDRGDSPRKSFPGGPVFVRRDGDDPEARPRFVRIDPPTQCEVEEVLLRIIKSVTAHLCKRGRLDEDLDEDLHAPLFGVHALAARSARRGTGRGDEELPHLCARIEGYSLHAAVAIHEHDRQGLEALCRYGARPAFSVNRLHELPDGRYAYRMKRVFSDGTSVIILTAHELLARLVALIPPPKIHLTKYSGIFAPRARGRAALTGRPSRPRTPPPPSETDSTSLPSTSSPLLESIPAPAPDDDPAPPPDPLRPPRLPWSQLLQRVFAVDVLSCRACGGRMRIVAFITHPDVAAAILDHPQQGVPIRSRLRRKTRPHLGLGERPRGPPSRAAVDEPPGPGRLPPRPRQLDLPDRA